MNSPVNQETGEVNQRLLAQFIALNNELAVREEKLRNEMYSAERLHLRDLINFSKKLNSQTQAQLERTQQQNQRLQQQLQEVTEELKEYRQELMYTQEDLVNALKAERLTPNQAQEIAKTLLAEGEPTREALVRLLNVIYGSTLKPWDLEYKPYSLTSSVVTKTSDSSFDSMRFSPEFIQLKAQFEQLRAQFIALKSQLARLDIRRC